MLPDTVINNVHFKCSIYHKRNNRYERMQCEKEVLMTIYTNQILVYTCCDIEGSTGILVGGVIGIGYGGATGRLDG